MLQTLDRIEALGRLSFTFLLRTCNAYRVRDHVSTTISTLRVEFSRSQRVAPLLHVGRFPVHPIAQGLVDATFVIDVGVL